MDEKCDDEFQTDLDTHSVFPVIFGPDSKMTCNICADPIRGYGLRCFCCRGYGLHIDCLAKREPSLFLMMKARADSTLAAAHTHSLGPCNIFALTLCGVCYTPIWGICVQGEMCNNCGEVFHSRCAKKLGATSPSKCLKRNLNAKDIPEETFKQSLLNYFEELTESKQTGDTSIEAAILTRDLLCIQENIIYAGFRHGKIRIGGNRRSITNRDDLRNIVPAFVRVIEEFELLASSAIMKSGLFGDSSLCRIASELRNLVKNELEMDIAELIRRRFCGSKIFSFTTLQQLLSAGYLCQYNGDVVTFGNSIGLDLRISFISETKSLLSSVECCLLSTDNLILNESALKIIEKRISLKHGQTRETYQTVFNYLIAWASFNAMDFFRKTAKIEKVQFCKTFGIGDLHSSIVETVGETKILMDISQLGAERCVYLKNRMVLIKTYVNLWLAEYEHFFGAEDFLECLWAAIIADLEIPKMVERLFNRENLNNNIIGHKRNFRSQSRANSVASKI
jgi:hypothetical protein